MRQAVASLSLGFCLLGSRDRGLPGPSDVVPYCVGPCAWGWSAYMCICIRVYMHICMLYIYIYTYICMQTKSTCRCCRVRKELHCKEAQRKGGNFLFASRLFCKRMLLHGPPKHHHCDRHLVGTNKLDTDLSSMYMVKRPSYLRQWSQRFSTASNKPSWPQICFC